MVLSTSQAAIVKNANFMVTLSRCRRSVQSKVCCWCVYVYVVVGTERPSGQVIGSRDDVVRKRAFGTSDKELANEVLLCKELHYTAPDLSLSINISIRQHLSRLPGQRINHSSSHPHLSPHQTIYHPSFTSPSPLPPNSHTPSISSYFSGRLHAPGSSHGPVSR